MIMKTFKMKTLIKKWKQHVNFSNNLVKIFVFPKPQQILIPACKQYLNQLI